MTTISMDEFRRDSAAAILLAQQGEIVVVTEAGKPAIQISAASTSPAEALADEQMETGSLSWMCELGERLTPPGPITSISNEEIDRIVYGL